MARISFSLISILALAAAPTADSSPGDTTVERRLPGDLRALINAPISKAAPKKHVLAVYACPNGNSAEWTLGAKPTPGADWHFDIQHVLAQLRYVRAQNPEVRYTLAVLEAPGKSFPAWRGKFATAGKPNEASLLLRDAVSLVEDAAEGFTDGGVRIPVDEIVVMAHSGGGSAISGYLQAPTPIPSKVSRIVYLDANYSFDAALHGGPLLDWLHGDKARQLIVVAYDDRQIEVNGKKVLSAPNRGTWGATTRMSSWLPDATKPITSQRGPFATTTALDGQVFFAVRENPDNSIWHTRLVGDLNGVIFGLLYPHAEVWLEGPRRYEGFVTSASTIASSQQTKATSAATALAIPPRAHGALGGRALFASIKVLPPAEREAALRRELLAGNIPTFCRKLVPVPIPETKAVIYVTPDYLAVGSDTDYVRVPLYPSTAQAVANAFNTSLPTTRMVDAIYAAADLKLPPLPMAPAKEKGADKLPPEQQIDARESLSAFLQHSDLIDKQRTGKAASALVAGSKKDIVLTNRLAEKPNRVAIYGWHKLDGKPIQPLTTAHKDTYADYSHGVRLVSTTMTIDGQPADLREVLKDPARAHLLSNEGPLTGGYMP